MESILYKELLVSLYKYLLNKEDCDNNLICKHSRNLDSIGEFGILLDNLKFGDNNKSASNATDISELLVEESKKWVLKVSSCSLLTNTLHMSIDRLSTYQKVIRQTLNEKQNYGSCKIDFNKNIIVLKDVEGTDPNKLNLSQLRISLLKDVIDRLVEFNGGNKADDDLSIYLIFVYHREGVRKNCLKCGIVLCKKGDKKLPITAEEFYKKRTTDMRLMAEHKYGLRVTSQTGWKEFFKKLGQAAVAIELLQNKHNRNIIIDIDNPSSGNNKGAPFILYNCARLATLFKAFDNKVEQHLYPELPSIENVNLSLLDQPEEWQLLFLYVLQFPYVVNGSIKGIMEGELNIYSLCNLLYGMCSVFSVYYRRIRILTEPRDHLFDVLHARIYLLKCVEQVLHNGLYLLNIDPVKQM